MGLGLEAADFVWALGKKAIGAALEAARNRVPSTKKSADGIKSDGKAAYDELQARIAEREGRK